MFCFDQSAVLHFGTGRLIPAVRPTPRRQGARSHPSIQASTRDQATNVISPLFFNKSQAFLLIATDRSHPSIFLNKICEEAPKEQKI
jgi:hypothetical protein